MATASGDDGDTRRLTTPREGDTQGRNPAPPEPSFSFGPFRLFPRQRLLLHGDTPVSLGSRAFEILLALVESPGELLEKEALEARAWPGLMVEESNLRAQITALRRVLAHGGMGERYVLAIPGRGYRFVVPVARSTAAAAQVQVVDTGHTLPGRLTRPIGRVEVVTMIGNRLRRQRFITIIGAAGIGKTTVALAVADQLAASYDDGVRFVDLAPVRDPNLVSSALASVLGAALRVENPYPALRSILRDKNMLLVLDSCEHVVQAAAELVEEMLKDAPRVHVLATSREPLRAEDERVHRLPPLQTSPASITLTAAEALAYPAIQLFVERAAASTDGYELTDADVPVVAQICRRLDGIALAIELAAGRVSAFGVHGIAARLDNRFALLTHGRRTAPPRHQTLRAALDWSYELLPEAERIVMRRLGIFAGWFTIEAAGAVAGRGIGAAHVNECVANLVDRSLLTADVRAVIVNYRLSDTAHAYALDRLRESGDLPMVAERHAHYQRALFERAEALWDVEPVAAWLLSCGGQIDDLRSALDWAFSPGGEPSAGVALTIAAMPLLFEMALIAECRSRAERALAVLRDGDDRLRMQLCAAIAASQFHASSNRDARATWATTLQIAETLGDTDYRLRALWGLYATHCKGGAFVEALGFARRFAQVAENSADANGRPLADRMIGAALFLLGDQSGARRHIERTLASYVRPVPRSHLFRFQFDQRVVARAVLARVLWLQGFADRAARCAEGNVQDAISINHTLSLCTALAQGACPITQGHSKKAFHSMSDCADAVLGEDFAGFARGLGEAVQ